MEIGTAGVPLNTSFILDPIRHDCMGKDAILMNDDNYSGGQAARATGPDQEVFAFPKDGYAPVDTFTGNFLIYIFYATDYVSEAFVIEVWRRDPITEEESHDPSKDMTIEGVDSSYKSAGFYGFFDQHYEYQFIIKTSPEFSGTYADIDLVQMLRENKNAYMSPSGYITDPELSGNQNYIARGTATVPHTTGQFGQVDVSFGVEFIEVPTIVFGAIKNDSGANARFIPSQSNYTTMGFTLEVVTHDDSTWSGQAGVDWIAMGKIKVIAF